MPAFLLDLIVVVIILVVIGLVAGVLVWALQKMYPQAPPIIANAIYVLAVLFALYVIVAWIAGLPLPTPTRGVR